MIFLRYVGVQLVAYGIDMGTFLLLVKGASVGPVMANVTAKICAGLVAFIVHRHFTFERAAPSDAPHQAVRYGLLLAFNVPLTSAALALVLMGVGKPAISKLIADVVCVGITYWISKLFVFTARRRSGDVPS